MAEIAVSLTTQQLRDLEELAASSGVSVSELASAAFSHALSQNYELPSSGGQVIPFQGLKTAPKGTEP